MRRKPSDYLKQIWFDSLVYTPHGLEHLVREVGASRVAIGTDYPFDMGERGVWYRDAARCTTG
jgi:aminocarboxymuconate-semialdehyde decarboxylase